MAILQIVLLFFIAIMLAVVTVYMWYSAVRSSPKYELRRRMRRLALDIENRRFPEELRSEILREMDPLDKLLLRIKPFSKLDMLIDKAGLKIELKAFMLIILIAAASAFSLGLLIRMFIAVPGRGDIVMSVILAAVGALAPIYYLMFKRGQRLNRFTEQFPDALDMISRSLKAGHSFTAAMQLVASEMADPVAALFRTAYDEQALGVSTREAVAHMTDRVESTDLRFFVIAINIHREIGGNLGEILERLAKTIRERLVIRRQVRVYTAQARMSGYILAAVPVAMAFFFYNMSEGYMQELWTTDITWKGVKVGVLAIAFAVVAQVTGFLVIRKIVNIRI
jgi:tight adherence protein B